jgi:hypothetical protein
MARSPATKRLRRRWIVFAVVASALIVLWMYLEAQPTRSARRSSVLAAKVGSTAEGESGGFTAREATALRAYLRAWEASWWRRSADLVRIGDTPDFSDTPDSTWPRARRSYQEAATAYLDEEGRLAALSPPSAMRAGNEAYMAAVRRQATRFQRLADAFGGTDPATMERRLEALERSQMQFDADGARWERAVIAACRASGVNIPKIVRREYISNGHRAP